MRLSTSIVALFAAFNAASASPVTEKRTITGYAVRDFTRDCTNPHKCIYTFTIDTGEEKQPCTIVDETPVLKKRTGPTAISHPWYAKLCKENDRWEISWGWDYQGDFTVMTIVHKPNKKQAFFGYKSPNVGLPIVKYPDVGPNAISTLGS